MSDTAPLTPLIVNDSPEEKFREYLASRPRTQRYTGQQRDMVKYIFSKHNHFDADTLIDEMKQAGLVKKCVVAVPNHLLEQFSREFQQGYPNARLLVAANEDFTRERRKYLTAKIASVSINTNGAVATFEDGTMFPVGAGLTIS